MESWAPSLLSIALGIGLAAACGLRVFLPLFLASVLTHNSIGGFGLNEGYAWLGGWPAMIALGTATVIELLGYYVPVIDHALDAIAVPLSTAAGTFIALGTFIDLPDHVAWGLALIAGGGLAGLISAGTAATRLASTATTAGLGNSVLATAETGGSLLLSLAAWFLPALAILLIVLLIVAMIGLLRKARRKLG